MDPVTHDLISERDKLSAKKLLMTEANVNHNINQGDRPVSKSSISITTDARAAINSNTAYVSPVEQIKLFRAKCGIAEPVQVSTKPKTLSLKQEIAKYESFDKNEYSFSSFWRKYEKFLPLLSKMARRYGSIPASSVPSESSFSIAGYSARKIRSSLSGKNLKYSMFLKNKI